MKNFWLQILLKFSPSRIFISNKRLFITDVQVESASWVQTNHVYKCDRHQVLRNDLVDTLLGALYIKSEPEGQKHHRFERKAVKEHVYQISDLDHLIYSQNLKSVLFFVKMVQRKCCI
jgi:hypothetical protein